MRPGERRLRYGPPAKHASAACSWTSPHCDRFVDPDSLIEVVDVQGPRVVVKKIGS